MFLSRIIFLALASFALAACTPNSPRNENTVADKLGTPSGEKVDYVIDLKTKNDATAHANDARRSGATVELLDAEGRVLRVKGPAGQLAVPNDALIANNVPLKIVRPQADVQPVEVSADAAIESFMTGRKVVGVDDLVARIPEADGRKVTVAVFDTGIDFGVKGLQKHSDGRQKLVGFYDLTGFGAVGTAALVDTDTASRVVVDGVAIEIDSTIGAQKIESKGVIDELQLAKDYLAGEGGVDIDSNGEVNNKFQFLYGVNADGKPAVFVDVNRDGKISDRAKEELTDYNTTFKYVDMRPEVSPSGARALAVSIVGGKVQFHSVIGGHGTSCAIIIAGENFANGKLRGMAPKADLVGFVLDVTGQDVYTLDQFTKMFLKAKEVKVDAISISWGFATADLKSARFVSEFLDREIASAGISIGIAAGNEGPGISTAAADDYIPRNGFGVGAYVSVEQARNVYGWTGATENSIIWYSSMGPTRGGRQIPDVVSPLMSWVRGERGIAAPQFYSFSGTSSATPAMIGATSALVSAIKAKGMKVDLRILKLALQQSASPLDNVIAVRQGAGLINVNAAFDVYAGLIKELTAAQADTTKSTAFPVELKVSTQLENQQLKGEGIHFKNYRPSAVIDLALSEESKKLVDQLTYTESLQISHGGKFMTTPAVVPVQVNGGRFAIGFDQSKMSQPGSYNDVIKIVRADGVVLARIAVVVEVPALSSQGLLLAVNQEVNPFDTLRMPVKLERAGSLVFQGAVREVTGGERTFIGLHIRNKDGVVVSDNLIEHTRTVENFEIRTDSLPAGNYEAILFRHFGRPGAVLNKIALTAHLRVPFASLLAARQLGSQVEVALRAEDNLAIETAKLTIEGRVISSTLTKQLSNVARPGFYGELDLGKKLESVQLRLRQSAGDSVLESMLHMSVALVDRESGQPSHRGWSNIVESGSPMSETALAPAAQKLQVIAYPNIANWDSITTTDVVLDAGVLLETPLSAEQKLSTVLQPMQVTRILFDAANVPAKAFGSLELKNKAGQVLETVRVEF
ncbi:MAG: S8 family serine peptidase [Bdellovibrionia bacterium]